MTIDALTIGENDIAIVGMAAHLPGAEDIQAYWRNLRDGVSSIRRVTDEELRAAGEDPGLIRHRDYVPFAAPLDGFEMFDADFFGFSPKEAAIMDPQHRQFLETAWEALETAGHVPENFPGQVGVFAGCGMGSYFYFNVCSNPDLVDNTGMFLLRHTGNDKDFMTTRLSHVLDLQGPSINLQTACSTSLVATHYATQALLNGECDMALAGGVTIELPQGRGYLFKENEILSPDGACHAFDHRAEGTVFGSGSGVVVLRRLADAVADGDHIWAVIKGTAVNNDGAQKAGYLAPSVDGQAVAVAEAHAVADITADTVDYVECHGTGTYLGDPIEIAALTQGFQESSDALGHCRVGSVKTNIGHLDTAAGVASLIKASLALHHKQMPPSLGYEAPNPAIDFDNSPFRVNDRLTEWPARAHPRRAGVNSLGVGGTNAHAVLQEAPIRAVSEDSDFPFQILTVSGRSKGALNDNAQRLSAHLRTALDQPLADVAWTLQNGRRAFEKRRIVVAETHEEAARLLSEDTPRRVHTHTALDSPETVFMFPGGGAQYAGMARDLYETEPVFAEWMDRGLAHLATLTEEDIRALWLPEGDTKSADAALTRPSRQLPLIMIVEYALAQLWISWGVTPTALTGHSMGENTAACVAGVMSFEDCIGLVHLRGTLFDTVPAGGMLSVAMPADKLRPMLGADLDLGAENAPELSVASGPQAKLDALEAQLRAQDIDCQRIKIDIAAHSRMLEPILARFGDYLRGIQLHPPQMPLTSNRTGTLMTAEQATDPNYWVDHLRGTVHFADCVGALAQDNRIFLEVGPGKALSALTRQHRDVTANQVLSSLRHPDDAIADDKHMFEVLGRFWALGATFDWEQIWGDATRQRVPLPTYAFQRAPYFIEPGQATNESAPQFLMRDDDVSAWGWQPVWRPRSAQVEVDVTDGLDQADPQVWLMFMDEAGLASRAAVPLREAGHDVIEIRPGDTFSRQGEHGYTLAPERGREGYDLLLQDLSLRGLIPTRIAHYWLVTQGENHRPGSSFFHRVQEQGFYALMFLAQALESENTPRPLHINVITNGAERLRDEALPYPGKSTISGPARVIPRELNNVTVSTLDIQLPDPVETSFWSRAKQQALQDQAFQALALRGLEELLSEPANVQAALRGDRRFECAIRPVALPQAPVVQKGGTYLITGGFGGIGLTLAQDFASKGGNLVLLSRKPLPERDIWDEYLARHAPQDKMATRIRAVQMLEQAGAKVSVVAADVCNAGQMADARKLAEAQFGRITGVIHGAGVIDDAPLLAKSPASVEDVFTPKIHGTEILGDVFPDGSVDWIVLFSSSSTVTAPAGQIDYVAANAFLNAFAQSRSGQTKVIALNWGIWSEVGMAAEAVAARMGDVPTAPVEPVDLPLLDTASFDAHGNRVFGATYSADDWFIDEHRTKAGDALLPGTGYLTLAAHALHAHHESGAFEIRDLAFLRPLRIADGASRHVQVRLTRSDEGYGFDVLADATLNGRKGHALTAQGGLALSPMHRPQALDLDAIRARCGTPLASSGKLTAAQEVHLAFGPRWKVLDQTALGQGEGIATLSLPAAAQHDNCLIHPALMDIATGWAMDLIEGYQPTHLWVPVRYGRVRIHGAVPETVVSWVRNAADNRADAETASFDVTLCATDGTVVAEITGFAIRKLDNLDILKAAPRLTQAEIEFDDATGSTQPLSPAEERLAHNLSQGILPAEGVDVFHRVLALNARQVVVSSMDLDALTRQAAAVTGSNTATQSFDRPQLDSDFVAPETEIERVLAGFWQDLLGVANVGVEDSFFDLGGHSLIAVRLFAMVKKTFHVDFPISVLFEAPTIRKCADLITEQTGVIPESDSADAPKAPERRFKHLVPMHDGDGGPRQPFFLIAGMFGNVLNLRHLAHLLGADRPFFGLQAKGLYGGETPHETIEDAARDYIVEMQMVQPSGPYMLGGFSGGGITAYEIARQLEQMGEDVSLVVMLDTPLPQRRPLSRVDRLIIQWAQAREKGVFYPLIWARNRIVWEIAKRRQSAVTEIETGFHNAEIEAAFYRAIARYDVAPWDGRLMLYRPPLQGKWTVSGGKLVNSERSYVLSDNDWGRYVPHVEVHEVPGDHDSMVLEPNVRVLAAMMHDAIEGAEAVQNGNGEVLAFRKRPAAE